MFHGFLSVLHENGATVFKLGEDSFFATSYPIQYSLTKINSTAWFTDEERTVKVKVHVITSYSYNEGTTAHILNFDSRWGWAFSFTPQERAHGFQWIKEFVC